MAIKKTIEIDVEQVQAMGGLQALEKELQKTETQSKSLKQELRELKQQLAELPEGSAEYNKIAQRAGEVSDKISDISQRVKNLGSDTKVIDGVVQGAQTLSGAFTVASSASALLGNENEDLQKTMVKVEAAIGLTVGIQSIANALQKESALAILASNVATKIQIGLQTAYTAVVAGTTGALKALRLALISTGVGALVVGLGYLVSKLIDNKDATDDQKKSQEELNNVLNDSIDVYNRYSKIIDFSTKTRTLQAKIAGASEKELQAIQQKGFEDQQQNLKDQEINLKKQLENDKANLDTKLKIIKEIDKNSKAQIDLERERQLNQLSFEADIAEKRREKQQEASDKAREKAIADAKKLEELEKARLEKLNDLYASYLKNNQDASAVTEQEKLDLQKQRDLEEINQLAKTENEKANLRALLNEKYFNLQLALDQKLAEDKAKKDQEKIAKEDAEWLRLQELTMEKAEYDKLVLTQKYEQEYQAAAGNAELQKALREQLDEDIKAVDEKEAERKRILKDQEIALAGQTLGKISEMLGKNSKAGKAFAVAQALFNTYQGITAELATKAVTPYEIGLKVANIAFVAATGFKAVKQILSTSEKGGSSAGGAASGSASSGTAPAPAPQFNIVGQSSTNQLSATIAGQQNRPVQTYVVGNQVTTQQALDRNAVGVATFG